MTYFFFYSIIFTVIISGTGKLYWDNMAYIKDITNKLSVLYLTRSRWMHLVQVPDYLYQRLPSSFTADIEAGLSSSQFDITANVADGDTRAGLDQQAKREVRKIMKSRKVNFDEARRIYTEQRFAKNNIGPDGRPRDPKFVSFS
jgi:hypothetical protein